MILLIDDMRDLKADMIARNYDAGIALLKTDIVFTKILLDHDLASFDANGKEYTGYDVACFIEEKAHTDPTWNIPELECVSSNPSGRLKIMQVEFNLRRLKESRNGR